MCARIMETLPSKAWMPSDTAPGRTRTKQTGMQSGSSRSSQRSTQGRRPRQHARRGMAPRSMLVSHPLHELVVDLVHNGLFLCQGSGTRCVSHHGYQAEGRQCHDGRNTPLDLLRPRASTTIGRHEPRSTDAWCSRSECGRARLRCGADTAAVRHDASARPSCGSSHEPCAGRRQV